MILIQEVMNMTTDEITKQLKCCRRTGQSTYQAQCPAHDDKKASLTITDAEDKTLMYCHARL